MKLNYLTTRDLLDTFDYYNTSYSSKPISDKSIYRVNLAGTPKKEIGIGVEGKELIIRIRGKPYKNFYVNFDVYTAEGATAEYKDGMLTVELPMKKKEVLQIPIA